MNNEFNMLVGRGIFTVIISIILTVGGCVSYSNTKAAQLLSAGIDANSVRCVIDNGGDNDVSCSLAASGINNGN